MASKNKPASFTALHSLDTRIINQAYELVSIDAIRPHPRNPRQGDVASIAESIQTNGFYGACVVQRSTGFILAGNHRWQADRAAGEKIIPVIWVDVDDDRALRILLADNRTSDVAGYDDKALAELLQDIQDRTGSLLGTGFDGAALDELLSSLGSGSSEEEDPGPRFSPEKIRAGSVADLAPTEAERQVLAGRKLLVEYSGGKDSTAAAIWARHYFPENETELLFVDLGADFVGFHLYLHDTAKFLGVPLVILRSKRTVLDTMLEKGEWPHFLHPYCHENLHQPLDDYMHQHQPESIAILRGGRLSERAATGKRNQSRFLVVDRMKDYTYFQPLYFSDKETSVKLLEEAGVPIWEGYTCGLQRTACRICPGQRPYAYSAIRANFPEVWRELLNLEARFGAGCWQGQEDGVKMSFEDAADKGQAKFKEGGYALP